MQNKTNKTNKTSAFASATVYTRREIVESCDFAELCKNNATIAKSAKSGVLSVNFAPHTTKSGVKFENYCTIYFKDGTTFAAPVERYANRKTQSASQIRLDASNRAKGKASASASIVDGLRFNAYEGQNGGYLFSVE